VNEGTLGNWVNRACEEAEGIEGVSKDDREELKRLRAEVAELRKERDVLQRSVVLWVMEAGVCGVSCIERRHRSAHSRARS
jgi:transposase